MSEHPTRPIFIHACGLNCAMGHEVAHIHQALRGDSRPNMVLDEQILNSGKSTVIGRVAQALPEMPEHLSHYDSRNNRLALSVLTQLTPKVEQAIAQFGAERIAVVLGTSTSSIADGEQALSEQNRSGQFPADFHYRKQELGDGAAFIAAYFGLTGPAYTISTACSSSGRVFISAQRLIRSGLVDAVIVGGVDTICQLTLNGFHGLEALSEQHCQPFDQHRSGINIGESAALMLLSAQPSEVALLGAGDSSDAHHISAPHPEGAGAEEAMRKALADAGLSASDIGYVNAHGTATPLNDSMESKAIFRVFGRDVPVSSTKPLTGHTLGAASATEAAIAWHLLTYPLPLPRQHCQQQADDIEVRLVESEQYLNGKAILSNSFAFGGNNISLIFGFVDDSLS